MKTVHLMGIGGAGMASLAGMFVERGWKVRGSDQKIYPPVSTELEEMKVEVFEGFKSENLEPRPDLVIVGNVISRGNPEAEALLQSGIPYTSMAQALAKYFLKDRRSVVVTGTHGKTTTTALLAWVLDQPDLAPGFFVGGIPKNFGRGYRIGSGTPFVTEGDEYDTAFFEKTPKFLHYLPRDIILTSVEFDHADIYLDLDQIIRQFEKLVFILPSNGSIVACGESEIVRKIVSLRRDLPVRFYGFERRNDWRADRISQTREGRSFDVVRGRKSVAHVDSPLLGDHNVLNVLACLAMADLLGVDPTKGAEAVRTFQGVRRRQEFLGEYRGVRLYDDFAHHPTAIHETLAGFKPMAEFTGGRLWAVFEPRSNTVRRRVFQTTLPQSFEPADEVILSPVYRKKDSLTDREMLQPEEVAEAIRRKGQRAVAAETMDEIVDMLVSGVRSGDIVVFMSNGNFDDVPLCVRDRLARPDLRLTGI